MKEAAYREVGRNDIHQELENILGKIQWASGYEWAEPNFILGTAKDFTAEDILSSQRGDFDFLCY